MRLLNDAYLKATAFFASSHGNDQCGSNGLPLTPNSIRITGRFQKLHSLSYSTLCKYVELQRGKHEQIMIVSEGHRRCLANKDDIASIYSIGQLKQWIFEILSGLAYLHSEKIVHRNLALENIYLDSKNRVRLADYGLYYMTEFGFSVLFPIGDPRYFPPEVLLENCESIRDSRGRQRTLSQSDYDSLCEYSSGTNVDSWSLGILILELISGLRLWTDLSLEQIFTNILNLTSNSELSVVDYFLSQFDSPNVQNLDADILDVIKQCLVLSPSQRPNACDLLQHCCFANLMVDSQSSILTYQPMRFTEELRCEYLRIEDIYNEREAELDDFFLRECSLEEVYYLWKLAGGDLEAVLRKNGLIKNTPPIINLCTFANADGETSGELHDSSTMYSSASLELDLTQLCERLAEVDPVDFYPLCEAENAELANTAMREAAKLPLIIRERDVEYQFHRLVLFDRLLKGYPYKKVSIVKEARVDIPPLYRAGVWAAVLDVQGNVYDEYNSIDKVSPRPIDRQIEVDVPRCHQYNELMSSPEAHKRLKRILKAWVSSHPQYVYWQGLDSLCAPFLFLNFNDEALAFACLKRFIAKYLHNFFLKDNSAVVQEYLALFSQLIAFHEPELSNHLNEIGFMSDLYAIPWFLTMYAHVFPLHKLFHLWDTLLLGSSVFPLCIGVSILQQLKSRLLTYGFNECILLFSDLPEVNIDQCVADSVRVFCATPKSAACRQHAPATKQIESSYQSKSTLTAEPLSLSELKKQRCCRISAEEMLTLLSSSSEGKTGKPKLVVLDIRSKEEYERGTLPDAVNAPMPSSPSELGTTQLSPSVRQFLDSYKYQVKVVVDSNSTVSGQAAGILVSLGYSKVCYLYNGINILKGSNHLIVPSSSV